MDREEFRKDVKLAVSGDKQAFSRLYALVYEELYRTAFYSLRNEHDAADAVSDTVLDAYNSIGKLWSEEAFRSWIFKILSVKIKRKQTDKNSIGLLFYCPVLTQFKIVHCSFFKLLRIC